MSGTDMWIFVVAGGPLVLFLVIVYALARRRNLRFAEKLEQDRATERLYRDQEQ